MSNKTPKFTLEGNREDFTEAVKILGMMSSLLSSLALTNFNDLPSETANDSIEGLGKLLNLAYDILLEMDTMRGNDEKA